MVSLIANKSEYSVISVLLICMMLKDFLKIAAVFIGFNINYIIVLFLLFTYFFYTLNFFSLKKSKIVVYTVSFYIYILLTLLIHFLLNNEFHYEAIQIGLSLFIEFFLGSFVLFIIQKNAFDYVEALKSSLQLVGWFTIVVSYIVIFFLLTSYQDVVDYSKHLVDEGVIINPIQTFSGGFILRLSGIFSSALTMGLFSCVFLSYYLFMSTRRLKILSIFIIVFPLLFLTFNRNTLIAMFIVLLMYLSKKVSFKLFTRLNQIIFIFILVSLIYLFFASQLVDKDIFTDSDNPLLKLSTFASRISIWSQLLSLEHLSDIIFGTGFVQGLARGKIFVDNSFFYFILQNGFMSIVLFYLLIIIIYKRLYAVAVKYQEDEIALGLTLFVVGLYTMLLNNTFYDIVYILFYFSYPIALIIKYTNLSNQKKV